MSTRKLDIAFANYDRTSALTDGAVTIEGVDPSFHTARIVPEVFEGMIRRRAYDAAELGWTYYLRTFADGPSPFVAIPVFPNRAFRHGAIYVNKASGIERPEDLIDKRIGELALYGHDAGVMAKGILSDEHGFRPEHNRWIVGGINFPMDPVDFVAHPVPDGIEVEWAGKDVNLGEMLDCGEIDALISADIPRSVLESSPRVGHLFRHYPSVERHYFRRTGIFPIMHTVVVTRELAEQEPETVKAVYCAFCKAKEQAAERYVKGRTFNNMNVMLPWLTSLVQEDRELLGADWWPYGIAANRVAIDAVLRYHHEQGLTRRRLTIEELFVPALLDT
jgi:hypothetical protein